MYKNQKKITNYIKEIISFLKKYYLKNKLNGFVIGLSGGIDSAVALLLLTKVVEKNKINVVIMPCDSNFKDEKDAKELCNKFSISYNVIDLTKTYQKIVKNIEKNIKLNQKTKNNIKVRLRMCTLYAIAQEKNAIVVGTSNFDEIYTGFFTKFGDGGCDILPLSKLIKKEIYTIAKILGVTEKIIKKTPSSGLEKNSCDEEELGFSYKILDDYLIGKKIDSKIKQKIEKMHKISEHKRSKIPEPPFFKR